MKRHTALFVILLFLLLAGAVFFRIQLGSDDLEFHLENEAAETTLQGIIKSFGTFGVEATHFLEQENGTVTLLVGLGESLDPFVGKAAIVQGQLSTTQSGKEILQVVNVDDLPEGTHESGGDIGTFDLQSSTWSDFQSDGLGVSFQKRDSWSMDVSENALQLNLPQDTQTQDADECTAPPCVLQQPDLIHIEYFSGDEVQSFDSFLSTFQPLTFVKIGKDGLSGFRKENPEGIIHFFLARQGGGYYELRYEPSFIRSLDSHANDFFQLISTFRLISLE